VRHYPAHKPCVASICTVSPAHCRATEQERQTARAASRAASFSSSAQNSQIGLTLGTYSHVVPELAD